MQAEGQKNSLVRVLKDTEANLLLISMRGTIGEEEALGLEAAILDSVRELRPGFGILNDMTLLERMDLSAAPAHNRIMDACNSAGVTHVARVFGDAEKDVGFNIMSYFHYDPTVVVRAYDTIADALHALLRTMRTDPR